MPDESRRQAVDRLQGAREQHTRSSERYEAAEGSSGELSAFTELKAAEEQSAAREAWLEWVDRGH